MGRRRPNGRWVKIHRTYTVEETARHLGVHKNTVRAWIRVGLPIIDRQRPTLIHGHDLQAFPDGRRKRARQVCSPKQIFCVKCRAPHEPAGGMADYLPLSTTSGNLRGICPACHILIHRRVNVSKLEAICADLEITFPHGDPRTRREPRPLLGL